MQIHPREIAMSHLQDFHHDTDTRSKSARWIIGLVLALVVAAVGYYAYRAAIPPPKPVPAVSDSNLPSP
jgi:hypothetical protein